MPEPGGQDEGSDSDILLEACRASPTFRQRYDMNTWRVIGGGQFAVVLLLYARPWGKDVAVKVLYKRHLSEAIRDKARQEAVCAERVGGDNIVKVYGPHETENLFWIEMEYVDGGNLKAELLSHPGIPVPYPRALAIARAVTAAVARAHGATPPVIHRDIKPANILLPANAQPAAKLGDFGISQIGEISKASTAGVPPGTPLYSPPEVLLGKPFGPKGDVYSLGLVLYEVFTGRMALPIRSDMSESEVYWILSRARPTPARTYAPELPRELRLLLSKALLRSPEGRPTASEMARVLDGLAEKASRPEEAKDPLARARRAALAAAALAAVLLPTIGLFELARERDKGPSLPQAGRGEEPPNARKPELTLPQRAAPTSNPLPSQGQDPIRIHGSQGQLDLTNATEDNLTDLTVTLEDGRGATFVARIPLPLAPGEGALLTRDQFEPPLPVANPPTKAKITARSKRGALSFIAPVPWGEP